MTKKTDEWKTFTNFDTALPMPEQITAVLGGTGRYRGRFYVTAEDKAEALDFLARSGVVRSPHVRSLQPVPKSQQARVEGLKEVGYLRYRDDVVLVVTHTPEGTRIGWPPVFLLQEECGPDWSWEGRIRNGGRWEPLSAEDTEHLRK